MIRRRAERESVSPQERLPRLREEELDRLVVGLKALRGRLEGCGARPEADLETVERLEETYRLLAQQLLEAKGLLGIERAAPGREKQYRST